MKRISLITLAVVAFSSPMAQAAIVANNVTFTVNTRPDGVALANQSLIDNSTIDIDVGYFSTFTDVQIASAVSTGNLAALEADFISVGIAHSPTGSRFQTQVLAAGNNSSTTAVGEASSYDLLAGKKIVLRIYDSVADQLGLVRFDTLFNTANPSPTPTSSTSVTLQDSPDTIDVIFAGAFSPVILSGPVDNIAGSTPNDGLGPIASQDEVFTLAVVVPEPSRALLGLLGVTGILMQRRRRA
jgi:hypothetical protein